MNYKQLKCKTLLQMILITLTCTTATSVVAQNDKVVPAYKITADLVSSYVWRGSLATQNPVPNIQPSFSYTKGNFEIGVWGSTDFVGSYKEIDPYIFLTSGQFKFVVTDYNWNFDRANYFNYKNSETGHRLEGTVGYTGPEAVPISVTWNTMFYGLDKKSSDSTKQAYSTYIELGYTKGAASFFFGFTPWASYYNNYGVTAFDLTATKKSFSIVNIGASITKALKINETYSLPLKATFVINPSATYSRNDYIHLIFGVTF